MIIRKIFISFRNWLNRVNCCRSSISVTGVLHTILNLTQLMEDKSLITDNDGGKFARISTLDDAVEDSSLTDAVPTDTTHTDLASARRLSPNVFDEVSDFLAVSILTYGLADFRKLIRDGKITPKGGNFGLPITLSDAAHFLALHLDDVKREVPPASFDVYIAGANLVVDKLLRPRIKDEEDAVLMVFDDERSDRELVFSIEVNTKERRITVSFRGSVTLHDLVTDSMAVLVQIPNPVDPGTTVGIHCGFRDYMYGKPARYGQVSERRKIDCICDHLFEILDQYPHYCIAITGHSLGGTLATLLAFDLAARGDHRIHGPITCISFASPRVGNLAFAIAFQSLERTRKIRCLRVANEKDIFPEIPRTGTKNPCGIVCVGDLTYRHVGVSLTLLRGGDYDISFPEHYQHPVQLFFRDWFNKAQTGGQSLLRLLCGENLAVNHSCMEYCARLHLNESALRKIRLDEVYGQLAQRRFSALTGN